MDVSKWFIYEASYCSAKERKWIFIYYINFLISTEPTKKYLFLPENVPPTHGPALASHRVSPCLVGGAEG